MGKVQVLKTGLSLVRKGANSLPKEKFNPKILGYPCPDRTINFATTEAADTYAKNAVVKALNCPKPYEKSVVINDKRIIYELNGDRTSCSVPYDAEGIWVHGHPDIFGKGKTTPFSGTDYQTFMTIDGLKSAVIYNSIGQKSSLIKKYKPCFWEKLISKFISEDKYNSLRIMAFVGGSNGALMNCNFKTKLKLNILAIKIHVANIRKNVANIRKYSEKYTELYNQELEKAKKDRNSVVRLHKFFARNAKKYGGIEYTTDFSNLLEKSV